MCAMRESNSFSFDASACSAISVLTYYLWSMQTTFLEWWPESDVAGKPSIEEQRHPQTAFLPHFYPPKGTSSETVLRWAIDHAWRNGYSRLVPFLKEIFARYHRRRWRKVL